MARVASRMFVCAAFVAAALFPTSLLAQGARPARLQVTVVDPSGAIVPDAVVTITGLEPGTQAAVAPTSKTTDKGTAIVEGLAAGRYSVSAEFAGFDLG